jgi:hypothetical protein
LGPGFRRKEEVGNGPGDNGSQEISQEEGREAQIRCEENDEEETVNHHAGNPATFPFWQPGGGYLYFNHTKQRHQTRP